MVSYQLEGVALHLERNRLANLESPVNPHTGKTVYAFESRAGYHPETQERLKCISPNRTDCQLSKM